MCKCLVFSKEIQLYSLLFRMNFSQSVLTISASVSPVTSLLHGHLPHFSAICWEVVALLNCLSAKYTVLV